MSHQFTAADGTPFEVDIDDPDGLPAAYVLSVHKAGSTLLNAMATQIANAAGRPVFALHRMLFAKGIKLDDCPADVLALLERPGTVFTAFRTPDFLEDVAQYRTAPKILLVRDPRDIVVSAFFSFAYSHNLPAAGNVRERMLKNRERVKTMDPSSFVLRGSADGPMRNMLTFMDHADRFEGFVVRRYEDVIFDKPALARDLAAVMSADVPDARLVAIAQKNDVRPDEERPMEHIRQVSPGNYKAHLSAEAQDYLKSEFAPIFSRFGYA